MSEQSKSDGKRTAISTREHAIAACDHILEVVKNLGDVLSRETTAIKSKGEHAVADFQDEKTTLTDRYLSAYTLFKEHAPFIGAQAPRHVDQLRRHHADFQNVLSANLTALEAARAATRSVIGAIAEIVAERKAGPSVYGDGATMSDNQPNRPSAITLDRAL